MNGAVDLSDEVRKSIVVVVIRKNDGFDAWVDVGDVASFSAF